MRMVTGSLSAGKLEGGAGILNKRDLSIQKLTCHYGNSDPVYEWDNRTLYASSKPVGTL